MKTRQVNDRLTNELKSLQTSEETVNSSASQTGLAEKKMMTSEVTPEEQARYDEYLKSINEARWFAVAFISSVCVCFLVYVLL